MSWFLRKIGVDPRHYFALVKLSWRVDMRTSKLSFGAQKKGKNPVLILILTALFYLILGIFFADMSYQTSDTFLGATIVVGGIMFMLGGMMLVEYNTIVISPDDYHILGYMPVNSRTYFFAKSTNLLLYMLTFATVLGGPTIVMHFLRDEPSVLRGLLAATAVYGTGLFVSLGAAVLYGALLRLLSPERLKNILAYIQFGVSFVIYGGYVVLPRLIENYTATAQVDKTAWLLLVPTTWFASLIELGYGDTSAFSLIGAGIAVGVLFLMLRGVVSRISLDYAARVSAMTTQSTSDSKPERRTKTGARRFSRFFRRPETRVVVRLVNAQLRHDNKFKLSIIGIIPLLIMYFFMGLQEGALSDPFVAGTEGLSKFFLFFFALLMIPLILKQNMEMSDAHEAAWIFYCTPSDKSKIVMASRNVLFMLLTLPALFFVFLLFNYYFGSPLHAILHTLTIAVISFVFLQFIYLASPKLPFAEPKARGGRSRLFTALFIILPGSGLGVLYVLIRFVYVSPTRFAVAMVCFALLIAVLEKLSYQRIRRAMRV
ncbi:MAG: hypothetical protein H6695_17755 [Deferribacteres bacterium]|nr:hypothetical protein [candidate division KSB1 bacterium]MCB9512028.1 hypothetical protein [Deferribacteres bacterium]